MEAKLRDFNEKLKVIQDFLDEHYQKYMLVGSGALLNCGIPLQRFCNDVDLEVIEDNDNGKLFKMLQDATTQSKDDEYKSLKRDGKEMPFTFTYKGVRVNIWLVKTFNHGHWVWKNGIKIATVYSVLKKKMSYKRAKDFQDLNGIIKTFAEL